MRTRSPHCRKILAPAAWAVAGGFWAAFAVAAAPAPQRLPPAQPAQAAPPAALSQPAPPPQAAQAPLPSGIDLTAIAAIVPAGAAGSAAGPCVDFYQYACGGWIASHSIPPAESSWNRFAELAAHNREQLRTLLEAAAAVPPAGSPAPKRSAEETQLGDYYASCMDEAGLDAKGLAPLRPGLDRIAAMHSLAELPETVAQLHRLGVEALFRFSAVIDFKRSDSSVAMIAAVDRGGMALPDRDLYLRGDAATVELRGLYRDHLRQMFILLGDAPERAAAEAGAALDFETRLARGTLDATARRDPNRLYHKLGRQELAALTPSFDWNAYLGTLGAPSMETLLVLEPDFVTAFGAALGGAGLDAVKSYLRWHLAHEAIDFLPRAFAAEDFAFFQRTLLGAQESEPRWRRCVAATDADLGGELGKAYVERAFGSAPKERARALVKEIERALEIDITTLPWMSEAGKRQALQKLRAVHEDVGYPDLWRDYEALHVVRGDALGNHQRAAALEVEREVAAIGHPPDADEWSLTPPTVNASYSPLRNEIEVPAGVLQPPLFDPARDEAANYGAIGSLIGHELTHGFDDLGRHFGADGALRNGWTAEDAAELDRRAACFAEQYGAYTAADGGHLDGHLTQGEAVADAGGVRIAFLAYRAALIGKTRQTLDGFSPEQRFFLAFAQTWCGERTPQAERLLGRSDPHSPERERVNGALADSPEFARAFSCKAGSPMVRPTVCRVW